MGTRPKGEKREIKDTVEGRQEIIPINWKNWQSFTSERSIHSSLESACMELNRIQG
jgi:hypothetical protein